MAGRLLVACVACALCVACSRSNSEHAPAPPVTATAQAARSPEAEPIVRTPADNWGTGLGCTPTAQARSLHGVLTVAPFGKGTDGARVDDGEQRWVVSYNAQPELRALDGRRVEAHGRPCQKQGEAIFGPHFDLEQIRALP
jgi:hypothetical protein